MSMSTTNKGNIMKKLIATLFAVVLLGLPLAGTAQAAEKVTICHAAGKVGTTKYVTLTISKNAVYKEQGGHFYENGTPQAGHEQDYLGACKKGDEPGGYPIVRKHKGTTGTTVLGGKTGQTQELETLPKTGINNPVVPWLAGGLLLLGSSLMLAFKPKK